RCRLVGERFVVYEAVVARRVNRFLVKASGLVAVVTDARELGADQGGAVLEILGAAPGPDLQLPVVLGERPQVGGSFLDRGEVVGRGVRQARVEVVIRHLGKRARGPEEGLGAGG